MFENLVHEIWSEVGGSVPTAMTESRHQLHWAALLVASVGHSLAEGESGKDDARLALEWLADDGLLAGVVAGGDCPFQAAFTPSDLIIHLLDEHHSSTAAYSIDGTRFSQVLNWLGEAIASHTGDDLAEPLSAPDLGLAPHPIGSGEPFNAESPWDLAEFGRWYGNAWHLFEKLSPGRRPSVSARDLALRLDLSATDTHGTPHRLVVGFSPGTPDIDEPHFFVEVSRMLLRRDLPLLPHGATWSEVSDAGETMAKAVFTGTALLASGDASMQPWRVKDFLRTVGEALTMT